MFRFKKYDGQDKEEWDEFVDKRSINGTFLQSRRFLEYHPAGRFKDCSLLIYDFKDQLAAVCPACEISEKGTKTFYSHKGSTFGGIILSKKYYKAKYLFDLIAEIKDYLKNNGFCKVYFKMTSDLFSTRENGLFYYAFQYHGFRERREISTYIHYPSYKQDILSNFSQGKRTNVHNCINENLTLKELTADYEISAFYSILCENLQKYSVAPTHTIEELLEFKHVRLPDNCGFYGVYKEDELLAGAFMFYFPKPNCAHTQYLAAKSAYARLSPMTFLYYSLIKIMREKGFINLSWGIATENFGQNVNLGLLTSKENFGSYYMNNHTFYWDLN